MKQVVSFAVVVGVLCICSTPAFAEFKSVGKATSGHSASSGAEIEAGGAKVGCLASETKEAPEWTIEKEGKAAETGPSLHIKQKWGRCESEIAGITRSVTGGECELEGQQPEKEETRSVKVLSTCSFKVTEGAKTCEVSVEPGENKELKSLHLAHSGLQNENTNLFFEVSGITTTVKGELCAIAGITATKTGKLRGADEALGISPESPAVPEFGLTYPGRRNGSIRGVGNETEVQLGNVRNMPVAGPGARFTTNEPGVTAVFFTVGEKTVAECAAHAFGANENCLMKKVRYARASGATIQFLNFQVVDANGAVETRLTVQGAPR